MSFFGEAINVLASFGFYDFFLPWMLILAVVFGLLQKKQYISEQVSVNAAIAFAVSFLGTVIAHGFFVRLFTFGSMALAGFLLLILFAAMFDFKPNELIKDVKDWNKMALPGLLILTTAVIVFISLGFGLRMPDILYIINTPIVATIVLLIVFAVVVSFIAGGKHGNGNGH